MPDARPRGLRHEAVAAVGAGSFAHVGQAAAGTPAGGGGSVRIVIVDIDAQFLGR